MPVRIKFYKNCYYHIFNRGVKKRPIFHDFNDYMKFSRQAKELSRQYEITIAAYCFMPNHYHFLIKTNEKPDISSFIRRLCQSYASHYNKKYFSSGHVFQGRFKSKRVSEISYLLFLTRYIHLNPIEIGANLTNYLWSSYKQYTEITLRPLIRVQNYSVLKYFSDMREYQRFCTISLEEAQNWLSKLSPSPGLI